MKGLDFDAEEIDEHLYSPYEKYKSEMKMSRFMGENTVLSPPPAEIKDLMDAFEDNGYEILVVGGAVRDAILNLPIKDYDLATNAKPDEIKEVVDGIKGYRYVLGPQAEKSLVNLTSLVNVPNQKEAIEITTFRKELGYAGGRTKGVFEPADTFEEDAERRDLTINAMGMNSKGEVIDPQGGLDDLQNGVIRAVGDPTQRFVEDPLRMIRAIRFSVRFGLPIDEETYQAIVANADLVSTLSGRRLRDEIGKVLVEPNGYKLLMETGVLPVLMPEFRGMEQYQHKLDYHPEGSLYNHYIEAFREFTTIPNRTELGAWALLFHDVAKPQTAEWNEEGGYHTFYGHDKQGSQLVLENYNNQDGPFEFSKKELQAIAWVADHHLGKFWEMKKPMKVSAMRENEAFPLLVQVIKGDMMGIRRGGDDQLQIRLKEINEITDKVNAQRAKTGNRPKDFARKVIQQLNVQGKEISEALTEIEEMVSTGQVASYDEALEVLKTNRNFNIEEHIPTNMSETTRFKVGEIYTIEAHGMGGWNTYELEVTNITPQYVVFAYDAKAVWSRDENGEVVRNSFRNKKYISSYDDAEYVVITNEFRRRDSKIAPTIMSGNFDLQPQIPISEY
tara:strand:+ start:1658 stop:3505 length:1848 start_codon:yes stop_codon:yes gene_type:complete